MNKLLAIQTELKAPKNQRNNFGNYNYRSAEDIMEALKPLLKKHDATLWLDDEMIQVGTRIYVRTTATFIDAELITKSHGWAREEETKKGMDASQITGAASSYARKYALNALFLIDDTKDSDATNDHKDDKEAAKPKTEAPKAEGVSRPGESVKGRVIGKIRSVVPGTYGFVTYTVKDTILSTKDDAKKAMMDDIKERDAEVQVDYTTTVKGKFTNNYIDKVTEAEALPF